MSYYKVGKIYRTKVDIMSSRRNEIAFPAGSFVRVWKVDSESSIGFESIDGKNRPGNTVYMDPFAATPLS
jgi:hypothetical protein